MLLAGLVVEQRLFLQRLLDAREVDDLRAFLFFEQRGGGLERIERDARIALRLVDQECAGVFREAQAEIAQAVYPIGEGAVDDRADVRG